jgi:hypothetical protein
MKKTWFLASMMLILVLLSAQPVSVEAVTTPPAEINLIRSQELFLKGWMKGKPVVITFDLGEEYYSDVNVVVHIEHWKSPHAVWSYDFTDSLDGADYDLTITTGGRRRPAGFYYIEVHITSLP